MIKRAEIKDAEIISKLGRLTFFESHEHSSPKNELDNYLNTKFSLTEITNELSDINNLFHLYYIDNEPIGYSKIIFNSPPAQISDNKDVCKLERIYISNKHYGKKIGLKLFNFNKELCIQNNQTALWLTVWTENERAINFYENLGFKTIGEISFKVGNVYNPNFVMWLEL